MSLPDELGRTLLNRDFKVVVGEMLIEARGKTRTKSSTLGRVVDGVTLLGTPGLPAVMVFSCLHHLT